MNRRELFKIASAAFVALNTAEAKTPGMPAMLMQLVGKAADWKPMLFNAHQNETVVALTETIIPRTDTPGAADAKVNRYMDLFLAAGAAGDRKRFLDGLTGLDYAAKARYGRQFAECGAEQRAALLGSLEIKHGSGEAEAPRGFFHQAKTMTVKIYFNTPEGYQELNKLGPPPSTVGCEHTAAHS